MHRFVDLALAALLTVVGISAPTHAIAQGGGGHRHHVALDVAVRHEGIDDDLASPVRYTAAAILAGASYVHRPSDWHIGVAGGWTTPRLEPARAEGPASFEDGLSVTVDAWTARRVWTSGDGRWAAFIGPGTAVEIGLRRHQFEGGGQQRYDNGFVGLGLAGLLEWSPTWGGRLSGRVMAPVAGVAARTSYTGLALDGPEIRVDLPPTFLLIRHRLAYLHPIGTRLAVSVHHEGSFLRHTEPLELAVAWQRLGIGLQWSWGGP